LATPSCDVAHHYFVLPYEHFSAELGRVVKVVQATDMMLFLQLTKHEKDMGMQGGTLFIHILLQWQHISKIKCVSVPILLEHICKEAVSFLFVTNPLFVCMVS